MPVEIIGKKPAKYRPSAASFSDSDILAIAPEIIERQERNIVDARRLAASLNEDQVPHPGGRRWNHTLIYLLMERGRKLGLGFVRRKRSEAASLRRVLRRPQCVIQAERAAEMAAAAKMRANSATTAPTAHSGGKVG